MVLELGPGVVRRDQDSGKIAAIERAQGWESIPVSGIVDLLYGQYGPRPVIDTPAGPTNPDHSGVDIAASYGTPVRSVAPGEVVFSGYDGARAQVVVVRHDDGSGAIYVHMDGWMASVGKRLRRGEILGYIGSTGMSTGPHLHFMRVLRVPVPYPTEYFWFDRTDVVDPFAIEANFVEQLSAPDPEEPVDCVIGAWPKQGGMSILVTTQGCRVVDILEEAIRVGVTLSSLFIVEAGQWRGYFVGAPAGANAGFPNMLNEWTPVFVRAAV